MTTSFIGFDWTVSVDFIISTVRMKPSLNVRSKLLSGSVLTELSGANGKSPSTVLYRGQKWRSDVLISSKHLRAVAIASQSHSAVSFESVAGISSRSSVTSTDVEVTFPRLILSLYE